MDIIRIGKYNNRRDSLSNVKTRRFFDAETDKFWTLYADDFVVFGKAENSDSLSQRVFQPPHAHRKVQKFLPRNRLDGFYASFLRTLLERNIP